MEYGFRAVVLRLGLIAGAFLALSALPAEADQTYSNPMMNGVPVDSCASWHADCGWDGADQFCRLQQSSGMGMAFGFPFARSFQLRDADRTWVIGEHTFCNSSCVAFSEVVCMSQTVTHTGDESFSPAIVDGVLADSCATWKKDCGSGGALLFCQSQGYPRARSFRIFNPDRPTWVIGSRRRCDGCDAFQQVTCTAP